MRNAKCPIFRLAKKQEGIVSYRQLAQLGQVHSTVKCRLRSGEWVRVLPSVIRMYWADDSWMQRVWAASLWIGSRGYISHWSAATLTGIGGLDDGFVEVTASKHPKELKRPPKWLRVHRLKTSRDLAFALLPGIRVTRPWKTIADIAGRVDDRQLAGLLAAAHRDGLVTLGELGREAARMQSRGKLGGGRFKQAVKAMKATDQLKVVA